MKLTKKIKVWFDSLWVRFERAQSERAKRFVANRDYL